MKNRSIRWPGKPLCEFIALRKDVPTKHMFWRLAILYHVVPAHCYENDHSRQLGDKLGIRPAWICIARRCVYIGVAHGSDAPLDGIHCLHLKGNGAPSWAP